jgi:pilus assembly protein FimV
VLGSYLPKDEVKRIQRSGSLAIKQAPEVKEAAAAAPEPPRKELKFGDGPAQMRRDEKPPASALASASAAPVPAPVEAAAQQPAAAPAPEPPAATPPEQPPSAAVPSTPTPASNPPKAAPKPKPVVRRPVPRGDVDIYEEAEQDLRRTRPK